MITVLTGLPRSGTAFCSVLLNLHPQCVAYHELAAYSKHYKEILKMCSADYVADCNTYGYLDKAQYGADKFIYIHHDPVHSFPSAEKATKKKLDLQGFYELQKMGSAWANEVKALQINRKDVFTIEGCERIWKHVFPDPFPEFKVSELIKLNIQHHNASDKFGENSKFEI